MFCGIFSASTLFAQACLSKYIQYVPCLSQLQFQSVTKIPFQHFCEITKANITDKFTKTSRGKGLLYDGEKEQQQP